MPRNSALTTKTLHWLICVMSLCRVASAQSASFQGLGDLPGGATEGYAIGVSPDGLAIAGHSFSSNGDEAFLWTAAGGMIALGDLLGGGFSSFATMASNNGTIAVGYGTVNAGYRPFRWTGGGMVNLGDLPGGGSNGFATGMSGDGVVVSGQSTSASGNEAFRWTSAGGMVGLGDLPGGAFNSSAWGVSADGTALFGDGTTATGSQAFVWTSAGGMVGLGYLPGGSVFSGAHGASDGGVFVVGASDSAASGPSGAEAFRWSAAGGMVGLGDLPGGVFGSFANGVSADGRVVVGGSETVNGTEAYFWTTATGMVNLKEHLISLGVSSVANWTLVNAHGVSADGTVIAGYGTNPAGQTEPWIARIPPPTITWDSDPLSPDRTTRSLRFRMDAPVTATGSPEQSAIQVTMIDLQNPNPPNLPQFPPPNFSGYESGTCAPRTCVGGPNNGAICVLPAPVPTDCPSPGVCTAAVESGGCARWVGKPGTFLEDQDTTTGASYRAARLQCSPFYWDWVTETASGPIAVVGAEIAPSSQYSVQAYSVVCKGVEAGCGDVSAPVTMYTRRSSDVTSAYNPPAISTQPDVTDVAQVVSKVKNLPGALVKSISQLQPNLVELNANLSALDIVAVVDGAKGFAYAFSGPCPCPSTVTCGPAAGSVACPSGTGPCVAAFGPGATCVKTCSGGDNIGDPCINSARHCPGGTCGSGFCRDRCGRCTP